MTNLNDPLVNGTSTYEDYRVAATYLTEEQEIWDAEIGEVCLPKDLHYNEMPFELEINGVIYVKE